MHLRRLEHHLATVADCLRAAFPNDFYQRCTYATFGLLALMRDEGEDVTAVGGDFAAFIVRGHRPIARSVSP